MDLRFVREYIEIPCLFSISGCVVEESWECKFEQSVEREPDVGRYSRLEHFFSLSKVRRVNFEAAADSSGLNSF